MSPTEPSRLVLRNELAELDRLAPFIEGWAQNDVSSETSLAVQLCVEEVVANVIMYGAPTGSSLEISVELERVAGTLVARIEDDGREFDPTQVPPPVMASSLQEAKPGNFGIHLVRGFANGMEYERRDGRNQLRLRFIEPLATSH
jgi:anti-sigma regulatory factor (Ser/Thr protein kinase)